MCVSSSDPVITMARRNVYAVSKSLVLLSGRSLHSNPHSLHRIVFASARVIFVLTEHFQALWLDFPLPKGTVHSLHDMSKCNYCLSIGTRPIMRYADTVLFLDV